MVYCFDIGGTFIKFGVPDRSGMVAELGRVNTPQKSFEELVIILKRAIEEMPGAARSVVSISLAGVIDPNSQKATVANIESLNGRRLCSDISQALGVPITISNDADCFALAEARLGAGRGHDHVFCIILGSGVGGGLILNGNIVGGSRGSGGSGGSGGVSGEWGHGPSVDPTAGGLIEPLERFSCACGGTDCLDTVGGARGLERLHRGIHAEDLGSTQIIGRWLEGDQAASLSVKVYVEHISRALSVVINTFGASIVPVGGGLSRSTALIAQIDLRVRDLVLARYDEPVVVPGRYGEIGGLIGAAQAGYDLQRVLFKKDPAA